MPDFEITYDVLPKFYPLFDEKSYYLLIYGGSGSGKSVFAAQKLIARCLKEKGHRFLVVRKTLKSIEESTFHNLKLNLGHLIKFCRINETKKSIRFPNGSEIISTGVDDPEKIKSISGISGIWVEEMTELDKSDFDQIDLRLRGERQQYKQVIGTFNPVSEESWVKKEFIDKVTENIHIHHSNYLDNLYLDDTDRAKLEGRFSADENLYRIYVLGEWGRVKTGAEFYNKFMYNEHVKSCQYDPERPLHISFDFNIVPYQTCEVIQIEKTTTGYLVRIIREICLKNPRNTIDDVCDEFKTIFASHRAGVYIYGDASGRRRNDSDRQNRTNYDKIESMLKSFINERSNRVQRSNPLIIEAKGFVNRILAGVEPVRILIDPGCKYLIEDMQGCKEDIEGKKSKERVYDKVTKEVYEQYGHTSDALTYFLCSAFESYFLKENTNVRFIASS
jgi:hypothetical protein